MLMSTDAGRGYVLNVKIDHRKYLLHTVDYDHRNRNLRFAKTGQA